MKKILIPLFLLAFFCLSAFGFMACSDNDTDDKLTLVRLNEVTHSVFYAPLYVAMHKGYFEAEGLKIELTNGGGSDRSMTAVMSKQADIGLMGPEAAVYVTAQGSTNHPIVFGQLTQKDGTFLIGRNAEPDFEWSDLANKEIIGGRIGGMPAMNLEHALNNNSLINGSNVNINYDVQFDLIAASFEGGTGDYCTMFEPSATNFQNSGKGHIIASVGSEAGNMPYTCFMAQKSYITENKDTVTKFMKAIVKGIEFVKEQPNSEIAKTIAPSFDGTSLAVLEASVKSYKDIDAYTSNPVMSEESFNNMINMLTQADKLDTTVEFEKIIDNSIAKSLVD